MPAPGHSDHSHPLSEELSPIGSWRDLFFSPTKQNKYRNFRELLDVLRDAGYKESVGDLVVSILKSGLFSKHVEFNPNGHWESGAALPSDMDKLKNFLSGLSIAWKLEDSDAETIAQALLDGVAISDFVELGASPAILGESCPCCDRQITAETNGLEIRIASSCEFPKGVFPIEVGLNVPSGKIIFANDLREFFDNSRGRDISSDLNLHRTTKRYAENGMAFGRVLHETGFNGYFRVSVDGNGDIRLRPRAMKLEGVEEIDLSQFESPELSAGWRDVGEKYVGNSSHIWCAADYEDLQAKFKGSAKQFKRFLAKNCIVLDVSPGLYNVSTVRFVPEYDKENIVRMEARINKISEPTSVKKQAITSITAGQIVWQAMRDYPSLYIKRPPAAAPVEHPHDSAGLNLLILPDFRRSKSKNEGLREFFAELAGEDKLKHMSQEDFYAVWDKFTISEKVETIHKVVNQLLLSSSSDWNPGGWCGDDDTLNSTSYEVELPIFPPGLQWSSLSIGFNSICKAAGMDEASEYHRPKGKAVSEDGFDFIEVEPAYMNESFRALAFNMLHSIIKGGPALPGADENEYIREKRLNSPKIALLVFKRLARRYPESVPDYCKELA